MTRPRRCGEQCEQVELRGGEIHRLAVAEHLVSADVDDEPRELEPPGADL